MKKDHLAKIRSYTTGHVTEVTAHIQGLPINRSSGYGAATIKIQNIS